MFDWTAHGRNQDRHNARTHSDLLKELQSNGSATIDKLILVKRLQMFDAKMDEYQSSRSRYVASKQNGRTGCRMPSWLRELCDLIPDTCSRSDSTSCVQPLSSSLPSPLGPDLRRSSSMQSVTPQVSDNDPLSEKTSRTLVQRVADDFAERLQVPLQAAPQNKTLMLCACAQTPSHYLNIAQPKAHQLMLDRVSVFTNHREDAECSNLDPHREAAYR